MRPVRATRNYYRQKISRVKLAAIIMLVVLILGSGVYFFYFSNVFQIKNIEINKLTDYKLVPAGKIRKIIYSLLKEKRLFILRGSNLFLFNEKLLREELSQDWRIESFEIIKIWPKTIEVRIKEAQPRAVLAILGDDSQYWLNSKGQIIGNLTSSSPSRLEIDQDESDSLLHLPTFYDTSSASLREPAYTALLEKILANLKENFWIKNKIDITLVKIANPADVFEIEITTREGWKIILDSEADFEKQIKNLALILDEKIGNRGNLSYVDLRFGNKIFYKLKEGE